MMLMWWLERTTGDGAGNEDWEEPGESGSGQNWGGAELVGLVVSGDESPERFSRHCASIEGLITPLCGNEQLGDGETVPEDGCYAWDRSKV